MVEVVRTAPDGAKVSVSIPATAGAVTWHGGVRFTGPGVARDFTVAPAGAQKAITQNILPGARSEVVRHTGYDIVLYEAPDRSDSVFVFAGPFHEAHTWFGGPAPRTSVLNQLVSTVDFADSETGARVTARPGVDLQRHGVMVVGSDARMTLMIMDARQERDRIPTFRGMTRGDAEVWRYRMDVREEEAARLAGTPYEWRYLFANKTAVVDVAFREKPPRGVTAGADLGQEHVEKVLGGLRVSWAG